MPAFSINIDNRKDGNIESYINQIGYRILNANRIPYRITFFYNKKREYNAYSSSINRSVNIYNGIILIADEEDEIAAVIAHEISHSVDAYNGLCRGIFQSTKYLLSPKKYERKADERAVDYLVKAGYNPLSIIIIYSKMMPQHRFDFLSSHDLPSRRVMFVYDYIYRKYPAFLANNRYIDNVYYQNFLLTSEKNRKKLQDNILSNSTKKVKYD
jgi:predicted Zn-dependent protease